MAGYSPKTARITGAKLLTKANIQKTIKEHRDKASKKADVSLDWWLKKVRQLVEFDPRDFFDETGGMIPINKLNDACAMALTGIEIKETTAVGTKGKTATVKKIKFSDRKAALDMLGKHFGAYVNELAIIQKLSDQELDIIVDKLTKKIG